MQSNIAPQPFVYDENFEKLVEKSLLPLFSTCPSHVVKIVISYPSTSSPTTSSPTVYSPPPPLPLPVASSVKKATTKKPLKGMEERPFYSKKLYPGQKQFMKRLKFN
jgi:hypothetical protein